MPFYRFEGLKTHRFNPHLSTAEVRKAVESPPGHVTGGKRSAHEIFLYVIQGELDANVAGKKKWVAAGDVIHVPQGAAFGRISSPVTLSRRVCPTA